MGTLPPENTNVFWIDTSNPDSPTLKAFVDGEWKPTSGGGGGGGSSSLSMLVISCSDNDMITGWEAATLHEAAQNFGITDEECAKLYAGEYSIVMTDSSPVLRFLSTELGEYNTNNIKYDPPCIGGYQSDKPELDLYHFEASEFGPEAYWLGYHGD